MSLALIGSVQQFNGENFNYSANFNEDLYYVTFIKLMYGFVFLDYLKICFDDLVDAYI